MGDWNHAESEGLKEQVSELVANLTSTSWLDSTRAKISDTKTVNNASFYGAQFFNIEDAGTAHISVLSPAGDAVAVTSTVNLYFGSKFRSRSTGIIMNNQVAIIIIINKSDITVAIGFYFRWMTSPIPT